VSVHDLRIAFADIPGAHTLTMRYEDGGKVEVFTIGDKLARVPAMSTHDQIRAALLDAVAAVEGDDPA
jgi:hypothetical protein